MLAAVPIEVEEAPEPAGYGLVDCLAAFDPLIESARGRLRRAIRSLSESGGLPFDPVAVEEVLAANLTAPLLQMSARVMILELNVARLEQALGGNSPQERFVSFVQRLQEPEIASRLLEEYRILTEHIVNYLDRWSTFSLEFLRHLSEDWEELRATLLDADPGPLVEVQGGAGDTHRNGRSVMILTFSNGARIVYKPRSLAVEAHFQQLLGWLNEHGAEPPFRRLKVSDRADHGWCEFATDSPCDDAKQVGRFYRRQGGYLAILYALEAADFHCENLIAGGEHPLLIDLEALFHPRVANALDRGRADDLAGAALGQSVLRTGLLPVRLWASEEDAGVDMSGLGGAGGQLTPRGVPCWESANTDEMKVVRKRVAMSGSRNRPRLHGAEVSACEHAGAVGDGFVHTYRLLLAHRQELCSLLNQFTGDEVRVIVRPTQTYATLLQESFHPDLLRQEGHRAAIFDRLQEAVEERPGLIKLIPFERGDLLKGDIPFFTTRPGSRHLWTSGGEVIENYFDEPGLQVVERRLGQLSEEDLERQLWVVRASIATMDSNSDGPKLGVGKRAGVRFPDRTEVTPRQLISEARRVGDRLQELAFGGQDDASWIGLVPVDERTWTLSPLGPDLYDGLPGVILFLAQLGAITAERRYTALAESGLHTLRRQIQKTADSAAIGGFSGWGGVLYALTHLGSIWRDPALFAEAEALLDGVSKCIERDKTLDVVGGAAGCVLALRSLQACRPSSRILKMVGACGEHLLRTAQTANGGVGWICSTKATAPLTGFAHGSAGIGYALLEASAMTGDARFSEGALLAFAHERSLFSPEHGNWPDLRSNGDGGFETAWCHGAPGIALSRLRSRGHLDDPLVNGEIRSALRTTFAEGFGGNHSLCHGDLGNADILLQAADILNEPDWRLLANHAVTSAMASVRDCGWICGNPAGVESPGLMTGLAGIGYAFLRFADPDGIPSVLSLEPPVTCHA